MSPTNPTNIPEARGKTGSPELGEVLDKERQLFQAGWEGGNLGSSCRPIERQNHRSTSLVHRWSLALHQGHQQWVCIGLVFGLLAMAIYFGVVAKEANGLVEIETAPRLKFDFQVDLNRAKWHELFAIPGVGETLARRIVDYRNQYGEFQSVDELKEVRGLGPISVSRIAPYLLPIDDTVR